MLKALRDNPFQSSMELAKVIGKPDKVVCVRNSLNQLRERNKVRKIRRWELVGNWSTHGKRRRDIQKIMSEGSYATATEMAKVIGLPTSKVGSALSKMRKEGKVRFVNGWEVCDSK
jgi:alkylated DNA nucleotide flippase Atl1